MPSTGHTIRFGVLYQADDTLSRTSSAGAGDGARRPGSPNPNPLCTDPDQTCQTSAVPLTIADNGSKHGYNYGFYAPGRMGGDRQSHRQLRPALRRLLGLRCGEPAQSPRQRGVEADRHHHRPCRLCALLLAAAVRTGGEPAMWRCSTTPRRPAAVSTNDTPKAERADYFDVGVEQKLFGDWTVGLDSFYKTSKNLIDEGQFGAPIILTPFNYAQGRQYGAELTAQLQTRRLHRLCQCLL